LGITSATPPAGSGTGEASDFCGLNEYSSNTPLNSIHFTPICEEDDKLVPVRSMYFGYIVTGQWNEHWQGQEVVRAGHCSQNSVGLAVASPAQAGAEPK
jgi:hypothetical protein